MNKNIPSSSNISSTATPQKDNTAPDVVDNFTQYLKDFNDAYKYVRTAYHSLWYDCYRVYNNRRVNIGYAGVNDAFIPETFTIVESLVSNIAGGDPRFQFTPTNEEQAQDTEVLTSMIDYYWNYNHMGVKCQQWVRDMLIYGNGILHVTWDAVHKVPVVQNVPLRDFFIDPAATTLENARFAGFRYLADKESLKKMKVLDPKTGEMVPKYDLSKLNDLEDTGRIGEPLDKQKKEQLTGSTLGSQNTRQVEVILMYYRDTKKIVEIANRSTVIREVDSPFQMPAKTQEVTIEVNGMPQKTMKTIDPIDIFLPFAVLRDYVDGSLFYARGEVEVIMPRQETLNDVENMDLDNTSYYTNVMWQIDPQYADMIPEIESIPGAVYPIPKGALSVIERPVMNQDLDMKKSEIKSEMRAATAADEVIQGISQSKGRVTATEVNSQLSQSQTRFSTKLANLESEGYAELGSIMFKMTQLFVDQKTAIRIAGPDGTSFKDYDPYEYSGYFEPTVKLRSTVERLDLEQGQKLNQMYQLLLGNQWVNQGEALRFILTKLGAYQEDINRMLQNPTPAPLRPKVDVKLMGDMNPLQVQDLTSMEGFGGEQSAQAMQQHGMPMPMDHSALPGINPAATTQAVANSPTPITAPQPGKMSGPQAPPVAPGVGR